MTEFLQNSIFILLWKVEIMLQPAVRTSYVFVVGFICSAVLHEYLSYLRLVHRIEFTGK